MKNQVSRIDKVALKKIRSNVNDILKQISNNLSKKRFKIFNILDIAPQDYLQNKNIFIKFNYKSLDIDKNNTPDFRLDITKNNKKIIRNNTFDTIICTEVLEHTSNPFDAIKEIYRILKHKGFLHLTVPLNFRIHGPFPDYWRFTEHGLKNVLKDFKKIKIESFSSNRFLFPTQYYVIAQKISF